MSIENIPDAAWEERLARLWLSLGIIEPTPFVARVHELVGELPAANAVGLFELGSANDSTGHSDLAVPLYRAALAAGLTGPRRRRATIQLASSLRNLGRTEESVSLLTAELALPSDELTGAVHAFLALALVDVGRDRDAVATSLLALSRYLPRYNQSLARYANELSGQV
jgi:Tetratrico peptide repeat